MNLKEFFDKLGSLDPDSGKWFFAIWVYVFSFFYLLITLWVFVLSPLSLVWLTYIRVTIVFIGMWFILYKLYE